jgi:hypothetical protein
MTISEHQKQLKLARKYARKNPLFLKAMRYESQTPPGYTNREDVFLRFATTADAIVSYPPSVLTSLPFTEIIYFPLSWKLLEIKAPTFWIKSELAQALIQTEIPQGIELRRNLPCGVIMLPEGLLFSPDGDPVDHIAFAQLFKGEAIEVKLPNNSLLGQKPQDKDVLMFFSHLAAGTVYASCVGIENLSAGEIDHGNWNPSEDYSNLDYKQNSELSEQSFLRKLEAIVFHSLFLMQQKPELIDSPHLYPHKQGLKGTNKQRKLTPNWIGKNYRYSRESQSSISHSSPRAHWRRGHWRRQAIGAERKDRKWIWIEPVLVSGDVE